MRILWIKANKILPAHSGGDIRSFNILQQLAKRDEVVFLSYYDGAPDLAYEAELQKRLPGAVCVCTGQRMESGWGRGWDYIRRLPEAAPYAVGRFASSAVQKSVRECLAQKNPDVAVDVAVCDFLDAAINYPDSSSDSGRIPTVLFQHNVESEIWRRHANNGSGLAMKMVYRREFRKMLGYEQATVRQFDHVIAVSESDRKLLSAWAEPDRVSVVPTGVDTGEFFPGEGAVREKPLVVFVGAMDWEPNVDAVKYFCADIWPGILNKVPKARFRIVGRNPDRRLFALAGDSVEVTGSVPSVGEHLREAAVVVVPLRIGGGTRLKIYEAMAVGKAVVSTTVGAEGLDVHAGQDLILADSARVFSESVIALLENPEMRRRMGQAALATSGKYGWVVVGDRFREVLRRVVGSGAEVG
jgi:polysaccharide biosynthesis protein PslH